MKYIKQTGSWMVKNFDLLSIIIATWLTWLGRPDFSQSVQAVLNDPGKPGQIFGVNSKVLDFPSGNLRQVLNKFKNYDLVLIYFYTHWDSESLIWQGNFEKTAEFYNSTIPFISVNCWSVDSECQNLIQIYRYPRISAFIVNRRKFVEYMNEIEPTPLHNFINKLHFPFYSPTNENDLFQYILTNDAIFVFIIEFYSLNFNNEINVLQEAASIKYGENIMTNKFEFLIISNSDINFQDFLDKYNIHSGQAMLMSLYQDPIYFKQTFTVANILEFLNKHGWKNKFTRIVRPYLASGRKSEFLNDFLKQGVTMIYIYNATRYYFIDETIDRINIELAADVYTSCNYTKNSTSDIWDYKLDNMIMEFYQFYNCSTLYPDGLFRANSCMDYSNTGLLSDPNYLNFDYIDSSQFDQFNWTCSPEFNRSVNFMKIDVNKHKELLSRLGIQISSRNFNKLVVIDMKNEKIHKMNSELSPPNLNHLLNQIYLNNLTSHFKTSISPLKFPPNNNLLFEFKSIDLTQLELKLFEKDSDLIVFYYTPWCNYCSSVFNLLTMLANYFHKYPQIHFTKLDTFSNDIPVKYQPEFVPALIMYPRGDKQNSHIYNIMDPNKAVLSDLVRFVLLHSGDKYLSLNVTLYNHNHQNQQQHHNNINNSTTTTNYIEASPKIVEHTHCNQQCFSIAKRTVNGLYDKYQHLLNSTQHELKDIESSIKDTCQNPKYYLTTTKLSGARNWMQYSQYQYYINHQYELIKQRRLRLTRITLLNEKINKFYLLTRAFHHYASSLSLTDLDFSIPVDFLAKHIANLSNI